MRGESPENLSKNILWNQSVNSLLEHQTLREKNHSLNEKNYI